MELKNMYQNIETMTQKKKLPIEQIKLNDDKFQKLVKSIQGFPEMLNIRPIVVNSEMIVLGGNMRLRACIEAGLKEVPVIIADGLTKEQEREFIIKDNVGFGEWDFEILANEWDDKSLIDWGMELPGQNLDANFNEFEEMEFKGIVKIHCKSIEEAQALHLKMASEGFKAELL